MTRQIGIYPGTFDPIHQGHIAFAVEARTSLQLDEVVFLPEPKPRGKQTVTDLIHRTAMIEQAIQSNDYMHVMQPDSLPDQFTVTSTLPRLQQAFPGDSLTFLIGSDTAKTLDKWPAIADLLKNASLAIGIRSGDDQQQISNLLQQLSTNLGVAIHFTCIDTPASHIASTDIRQPDGHTLQHPATIDYIRHHGLYQASNG